MFKVFKRPAPAPLRQPREREEWPADTSLPLPEVCEGNTASVWALWDRSLAEWEAQVRSMRTRCDGADPA